MNDSKDHKAAAEPPLDCRVGQRTKRYLNNGHEWDDDGCCVHCGFDGAEYWWWRRDTYEGRAMATEMPKCKVPNTEVSGAPRGELMNRELSARPLDRRVIRRSLTELLRLGPYVHEGAETRATMEEAADEIERLREEIGRLLDSREREGDRLDWLLSRLPGSVIRDLVGVMNDTRDAGEWRDLIDKAACFAPHNA